MNLWMHENIHISGIDFVGRVPPGAGTPVHRNRRAHGLVLQTGGSVTYSFLSGERLSLSPGDLIYLPISSDYDVDPSPDSDCYCINFFTVGALPSSPFRLHTASAAQYLKLYREAEHFHHSRQPARHEMVLSCLYTLLYTIKSEYYREYTPSVRLSLIQPALDYIDQHFTEGPVSISLLARMCGISEVHFRNTFRAVCGLPPLKYIHEMKLTRARQLLLSTNDPIHIIAEKCGFLSDSVFSREFRQAVGMSPSEYRRCL